MISIVQTLCLTFLAVLAAYWIMPVKKMKAVNKALKSLLGIVPIGRIVKALTEKRTKSLE